MYISIVYRAQEVISEKEITYKLYNQIQRLRRLRLPQYTKACLSVAAKSTKAKSKLALNIGQNEAKMLHCSVRRIQRWKAENGNVF